MAKKISISVEIAPDGTVKSTVNGVSGPACTQISAWLDSLGKVTEDRKTPDFYKDEKAQVTVSK